MTDLSDALLGINHSGPIRNAVVSHSGGPLNLQNTQLCNFEAQGFIRATESISVLPVS